MATLAQVRTRINDFLTDRWPALVNRQDNYFVAHGRYFQGKWTHTAEIDQTIDNDTLPDNLTDKPTDQLKVGEIDSEVPWMIFHFQPVYVLTYTTDH